MLTISVIIPVHTGGANFRRCLLNLARTAPPPSEIIIVADGDADGPWRLAEEVGAQVVRMPTPGGPARARNLGARLAQGDILFFIDADVAIGQKAMEQIRAIYRREPHLAAAFGSYDDAPAATNFLSQYKNLFHHYVHQTAREEASTFWGACGVIRREIFLALGGFDESYQQPAIEDIELGYRLKQAGHRIRLCKTLQVKHLKHWGVVSLLKSDIFHRALPWTDLILRDHLFIYDLNLRLCSRVSVILVQGLLGTSVGALWWPGSFAVAGLLALLLLILNAPLYRFFWRKRGLRFAILSIPWHWFYYFYSGLAFAIGAVRYLLHGQGSARTRLPKASGEWSGRPPELG